MEKTYDIRTTIMSGARCRKCNSILPDMTMEDHLESAFNMECPHAFPAEVYETPMMTWCRTNDMIRESKGLSFRLPTKAERTRWVNGCEQNREKAREIYLAFRDKFDNPKCENYKGCLRIKNEEARNIEKGDDFYKRIKAVFDGLY